MQNCLLNFEWGIVIVQFIAAIVLFLIVNWFGKHAIVSYDYTSITIFTEEESAPAVSSPYHERKPPPHSGWYAKKSSSASLKKLD